MTKVQKGELIKRLNENRVKLLINTNRDLSINFIKIPEGESIKEVEFMGMGFYKKDNKLFLIFWIKSNDDLYEYFERSEDELGKNYLHHEALYSLNINNVKRLNEVIEN